MTGREADDEVGSVVFLAAATMTGAEAAAPAGRNRGQGRGVLLLNYDAVVGGGGRQ